MGTVPISFRVFVTAAIVLFAVPCGAAGEADLSGRTILEIRLSGLKYTRESLARNCLVSRVGEPYRPEMVRRDREILDRLGVFSSIAVHPRAAKGGVLLEYEFKETFPYLPLVTADLTDADGLTVGPGVKAVNLFGRGISFSGAARFGQATTVEIQLRNPWLAGGHFIYRADAWYRDRYNELDDFDETSFELDARLGRTFGQRSRVGLIFRYLLMESAEDGITLSGDNRDNLHSVGFFLGFDSRDSSSLPTRGWWTELDVLRTGGLLGGDGDWWRVILDTRHYRALRPRHTLALFAYTALQTGEVGKDIPQYMDYNLGGTNSIRGWELGARESKNELIGTAEYRWIVREPRSFGVLGATFHLGVETALFGDVGIVWEDEESFGSDNVIAGGGIGLRFLIPFIRVVRFDVAYGESGSRLNLHIGGYEKAEKQRERIR